MILLPETRAAEGMKLIERLRQTIAESTHSYKGREYEGVTMTFGLCQFDNSSNINDCIHHADKAMYRGKHQGKNCTVLSDAADFYARAEHHSAA
jgi:diguanylate cyclase (GGDEF)-like protein